MLVCIAKRSARFEAAAGDLALGSLDFVNGIYSYGGSSLTAADVIDQTGWIGSGGLEIPASQPAAAKLLGDFATQVLTCQWTIVAEVEITEEFSGTAAYILTAQASDPTYFIQLDYDFAEWELSDEDNSNSRFTFDDANAISTGIHKVAVTRTDAGLSMSVAGNAVVNDNSSSLILPSPGHAMINPYLGGGPTGTGHTINIRSISIYDPVNDSILPTLSS